MKSSNLIYCIIFLLFLVSCKSTERSIKKKPENSHQKSGEFLYHGQNSQKESPKKEEKVQKEAIEPFIVPEGYLKADKLVTSSELAYLMDSWLSVPHQIGGNSRNGVDCSGLTTILLREGFGVNFIGSSSEMEEKVSKIDRSDLKTGDLVFFKINSTKVGHVGMYLSNNYFIHATLKKGVMISGLNENYYSKYFSGAGRIKL